MAFQELEGDLAIVIVKGVYKQAPLYTWDGQLFARVGGGFIRLKKDGSTSVPSTRLEHIETDLALFADTFGRLRIEQRDAKDVPVTLTHPENQSTRALPQD